MIFELMRLKDISFKCTGFNAQFDVQLTLSTGTKVDAHPTGMPNLWTYIDSKKKTPPPPPQKKKNSVAMDEKSLSTILCNKGDATTSELKLWQCKNNSYTAQTPGSRPSTNSDDFVIWEDVEIVNQPEFREMIRNTCLSFLLSHSTLIFF